MRRFRSNRRLGSGLALLALALQLLLTFGHVHAFSQASLGPRLSSAVAANDLPGSSDPAGKGQADFDCPVCVLIHMSATSTPSVAPELPLPSAVDFVTLRPHAELASASLPQLPYKARAPPAV
jgi:hypothetical protein